MNTLDSDKLKDLISVLQSAHRAGFSLSQSSSVEFLLETCTDLCLMLGHSFKIGKPARRLNKSAPNFSETESDALGNPKMIQYRPKNPPYWSPTAGIFFTSLASMCISLKNRIKFEEALYASKLNEFFKTLPIRQGRKTPQRSPYSDSSFKHKRKENRAYYRRQRQRK